MHRFYEWGRLRSPLHHIGVLVAISAITCAIFWGIQVAHENNIKGRVKVHECSTIRNESIRALCITHVG